MNAQAAPHRAGARATPARTALGAALGAIALFFAQDAQAVFTWAGGFFPAQSVTLRVGSANATVNNVTFNVNSASLFLNPVPVTGTPGNGTPATTPANGTEIQIDAAMPGLFGTYTLALSVDSSAGLSCVGGTGCGTTLIPFSTISWTSYNLDAGGGDIQTGTFNGAAGQPLASRSQASGLFGGTLTMRNVLIFQYDNATLYPSGTYQGRVVYTATNL
ncbi:hypothetical protein [Variovorax terrae]|uniref:Uncharacterized protein n=1 Tax=Variovorax terrae TaxID=2923278 RepID=A0A9X1VWZ8_9BURK|nr:hypothetical protein [Variovorax terrae]MCJ0764773.1 hypothetical protein [Variovorax terrae]